MLPFKHFSSYRKVWSVRNIKWLIISRFWANMTFYSALQAIFMSQRGLSYTEMFLYESIISLFSLVWDVPTGIWADQLGYRGILIVGRTIGVVYIVIFALAHGFWPFALCAALFGIELACISGSESALLHNSLLQKQMDSVSTAAFSLLISASSMGLVVGSVVGGILGAYNSQIPAIITIIPFSLAFLTTIPLQSVELQSKPKHQSPIRTLDLLKETWHLIHQYPKLVGISVFRDAMFALTLSIFWYNQLYFALAGIPITWFGLITAVGTALQALVGLTTPFVRKQLGTKFSLILSGGVSGIAYILLAVTHNAVIIVLLVTAVIVSYAWNPPILSDEMNRRVPQKSRATALSVLSVIGALTRIVINPIIGKVSELGPQGLGTVIGCCFLLFCIAVPFLFSRNGIPQTDISPTE